MSRSPLAVRILWTTYCFSIVCLGIFPAPVRAADGLGSAPTAVDIVLTELDRQADQLLSAKDVLGLYERYVKETAPTGELLKRLHTRIERLRTPAEVNHVRLGARWVPAAERERAISEEQALFNEAREAFERAASDPAQGQLAREKLELASRRNPEGVAADYVLGLVYATVLFKMDKAEEHFKKVLTRQPASTAAMVNLANIEIKSKKWSAAVSHLKLAAVGAVDRSEIVQNVGRVVASGKLKALLIEPSWLNKFELLGKELAISDPGLKHDPKVGWLYAPLVTGLGDSATADRDQINRSELVLKGRAIGFSPARGLILTHRDVATLDMGQTPASFTLKWLGTNGRPSEGAGHFRASDPWLGLSLIECQECDIPALRIATESVPAGLPVTAGKAGAGSSINGLSVLPFETHLRSSRQTAFGLSHRLEPNPTVAMLGSPLIGADGKAYGVIAGFPLPGEKVTSPWGIGGDRLARFLEKMAPDAKLPDSLQTAPSELNTEFLGGRVVLIEMFGRSVSVKELFSSRDLGQRVKARSNSTLEDPSCTWCGGSGTEDCLVKLCKNGAVTEYVPVESIEGTGAGARKVVRKQPVSVRCAHCQGAGVVRCRRCSGTGRDPVLDGGAG